MIIGPAIRNGARGLRPGVARPWTASRPSTAAGFAAADVHSFEVEVRDGFLEIELRAGKQYPKISAIEVERLGG